MLDLCWPSKASCTGLDSVPDSEHGVADTSSQPSSDSDDTIMQIPGLESKDKSDRKSVV